MVFSHLFFSVFPKGEAGLNGRPGLEGLRVLYPEILLYSIIDILFICMFIAGSLIDQVLTSFVAGKTRIKRRKGKYI